MIKAILLVLIGLYFTGCASGVLKEAEKRAPFDLQCPKEKVEVSFISQGIAGARGCGKQETYRFKGECLGTLGSPCTAIKEAK